MRSADLSPEEGEVENPSKFDQWLEKKLGNEGFQKALVGFAVVLGLGMSVGLFFLLPMVIGSLFDRWITSNLGINLLEGVIRMGIFFLYMFLISRMGDMRRLFAYHGAEHKTIRCYEAKLPLTVENVRRQTRLHPRCGTSFLLVVMVLDVYKRQESALSPPRACGCLQKKPPALQPKGPAPRGPHPRSCLCPTDRPPRASPPGSPADSAETGIRSPEFSPLPRPLSAGPWQ